MSANRNPGKAFADFANPEDLVHLNASNAKTHKGHIYCPQPGCASMILRASTATLVEREKSKLKLPQLPVTLAIIDTAGQSTESSASSETTLPADAASGPASSDLLQPYWRVTDMMAFENIGFSKTLPSGIKYLSCADCDTGPLGYHDPSVVDQSGQKEFLVAMNRVRYQDV